MFAFTHLILAWLLGKAMERSRKERLSYLDWAFLLGGSLVPDLDHLPGLFGFDAITNFHRTVTHSLVFMLVIGFVVYLVSQWYQKQYPVLSKLRPRHFAMLVMLGIATHLIADVFLPPGIQLFWPSLWTIYLQLSFPFLHLGQFPGIASVFTQPTFVRWEILLATLDMGLGVLWIGWLWWKRRITF